MSSRGWVRAQWVHIVFPRQVAALTSCLAEVTPLHPSLFAGRASWKQESFCGSVQCNSLRGPCRAKMLEAPTQHKAARPMP